MRKSVFHPVVQNQISHGLEINVTDAVLSGMKL